MASIHVSFAVKAVLRRESSGGHHFVIVNDFHRRMIFEAERVTISKLLEWEESLREAIARQKDIAEVLDVTVLHWQRFEEPDVVEI